MKRSLSLDISKDLHKKIILITGPRQVGKTTLSKSLLEDFLYLNYDNVFDRKQIHKSDIPFGKSNVILDELHKMKGWKKWLKGHYDVRAHKNALIVTGSARIDTYKKVGDSLAGRYFQFSLFPLDVKELVEQKITDSQTALDNLFKLGGFPEPYLSGSEREYKRWRQSHLQIILKQDLVETDTVSNIKSIELLTELMTERVGSTLSYNSLREDLSTDDKTVKRWCLQLINMYVFFQITPYSKKIKSSISKAPKYYFFDYPRIANDGARFENLVALSLYKEITYRNEVLGEQYSLHYLRIKTKAEVDFLICKDGKPTIMIECKFSDTNLTHHFATFEKSLGEIPKVLLVYHLKRETILKDGTQIVAAHKWLSKMDW